MLTEDEILTELRTYKTFAKAYREGKRKSELPSIPQNKDSQSSNAKLVIGIFLLPIISGFLSFAMTCRLKSLAVKLARLRVEADTFSLEPVSCGLNSAYTYLGLSLLAKNDLQGAIDCLDTSWRVHPCPHNVSYGLKRRLVGRLKNCEEAKKVVEQYIKMGQHFSLWPENWAKGI